MNNETTGLGAAVATDEGSERAVLGIMLIDPESTAEARRRLKFADFYKPIHQEIFLVAEKLDNNNEPIEPQAIITELVRSGGTKLSLAEISVLISELISEAPAPGSLTYYADKIHDASTRRALSTLGLIIQQKSAIDGDDNPTNIVEQLRAKLDDLAVERIGTEIPLAGDIVTATLEEIDALSKGGTVMGIPTGFGELDIALNGLRPGQMVVVAARPGVGKALELSTPIPTPTGMSTMGELEVGDLVLGRDGLPTTVVAATDIMYDRTCYKVEFSDGEVIIADADHLWVTETLDGKKNNSESITTSQILETLHFKGRANHSIKVASPLDLPEVPGLAITPHDFGLSFEDKAIPFEYLRGSIKQRLELLAGILHMEKEDLVPLDYISREFKNKISADSFFDLLVGLGYIVSSEYSPNNRTPYRVYALDKSTFTSFRQIVSITQVDSVPVRCIQVNNSDSMYLAGRAMIPTHNTALALDIVRSAAFRSGKSVLMFSLEMGKNELMMRALAAEAYVDLQSLKTGDLDEHKWQQLSVAASKMYASKLGIDDNASVTMTDIRAKARAFQRIHGLDLLVIDYIQLMNSDGRSDSRQQEVSEISRGIKLLAKEFGIPVIALSQLNRGSESRSDKKPVISDLRESGAIEQDADVVILLHREEMYEKESPRAGEADVIIAKQRSGPTGTVILSWLGKYSRFDNRSIRGD